MTTALSVVVTTLDNAATLPTCLDSVSWADDLLVLDSFSTDRTCEIARSRGARVMQHPFQGYAKQKQMAIDNAEHDWVLLLDADEALSSECAAEIRALMASGPEADAYGIARIEQLFWRWTSTEVRLNYFLRLFDRRTTAMNDIPVHAAPQTRGRQGRLRHGFYHYGEPDIHTKVEKLNHYSSGLVEYKAARGGPGAWRLVVYPPLAFVRSYVLKRNFLNGWAGFIGSMCMAFYAFLKVAKVYEHFQPSATELPEDARQAPEPTTSSLDKATATADAAADPDRERSGASKLA